MAWIEQYYNATDCPTLMSFEDFCKKGYLDVPYNPEGVPKTAFRWFAENRVRDTPDWGPAPNQTVGLKGLQTTTGKIEFISTSLSRFEAQGFVDEYRPFTASEILIPHHG